MNKLCWNISVRLMEMQKSFLQYIRIYDVHTIFHMWWRSHFYRNSPCGSVCVFFRNSFIGVENKQKEENLRLKSGIGSMENLVGYFPSWLDYIILYALNLILICIDQKCLWQSRCQLLSKYLLTKLSFLHIREAQKNESSRIANALAWIWKFAGDETF